MAKQLNELIFVGQLGKDPELKTTKSDSNVVNFSVASNDQYKSGDSVVKTTTWFRCVAWGESAKTYAKWLKKGSKVLVKGKLVCDPETGSPRTWKDQNDNWHSSFEVNVRELYFLDSVSSGNTTSASTESSDSREDVDEELPDFLQEP